jgi:serine/threonine-protein kinase HipA
LYPDGRPPILSPVYDFVATLPYIRGDSLALSFGEAKSLDGITIDRVRRFTDKARMPMGPVWRIAQETIERTAEAWKTLPHKDLIQADILKIIDDQIEKVTSATGKA